MLLKETVSSPKVKLIIGEVGLKCPECGKEMYAAWQKFVAKPPPLHGGRHTTPQSVRHMAACGSQAPGNHDHAGLIRRRRRIRQGCAQNPLCGAGRSDGPALNASIDIPVDVRGGQPPVQPLVDVTAHFLELTYGPTSTTILIRLHSSSAALRSGQPAGRNSSFIWPFSSPGASRTTPALCCGALSRIISSLPNFWHAFFRNDTNSSLVNLSCRQVSPTVVCG